MRRKPIEEPKFKGCGTCSPMPTTRQNKHKKRFISYDHGLCNIYFYEKGVQEAIETHYLGDFFEDDQATLEEIEECFAKEIRLFDYIDVEFVSALRGEEYEFNKEDGEWYLTGQNDGWV